MTGCLVVSKSIITRLIVIFETVVANVGLLATDDRALIRPGHLVDSEAAEARHCKINVIRCALEGTSV